MEFFFLRCRQVIHRQKSRISSQVTGTVAKNKEENVYWPPLLPVYLACILIMLMLQTFWSRIMQVCEAESFDPFITHHKRSWALVSWILEFVNGEHGKWDRQPTQATEERNTDCQRFTLRRTKQRGATRHSPRTFTSHCPCCVWVGTRGFDIATSRTAATAHASSRRTLEKREAPHASPTMNHHRMRLCHHLMPHACDNTDLTPATPHKLKEGMRRRTHHPTEWARLHINSLHALPDGTRNPTVICSTWTSSRYGTCGARFLPRWSACRTG